MSPIYVRPAREQSEHDRLIRYLQGKYKKKFEVAVNIDGVEPATFVKIGPATLMPDLVLTEGKKLVGLVEVETGESVNNLEAMAQWVHLSRARLPFHLYVPVHGYEAARRLCDSYQVRVGEVWTYRPTHDGFDLVKLHNDPNATASIRGVKAVPVSIFVPVPPKPPVPEVVEPPKPVVLAKPVPPAKAVVATKPAPAAAAKAAVAVRPEKVPAPAKAVVATKPAKASVSKVSKAAKASPKPSKPVKAAKPAKASKPAKSKPASRPAKKTTVRGKKAAPRKGR